MNRQAPGLPALQRALQAYLLHGDERVLRCVCGDARADGAQRAGIYAHAYRARLVEVLGEDFPGLRRWLGEAAFAALARDYLDAHPSTTPSVRWVGRHLADFLRVSSRADAALLAELATFEWTQGLVFDGADAPAVAAETLASLPAERWPRLRLRFQPTLKRLRLQWNIPAIWAAGEAGEPPPAARAEVAEWVLWRRADLVHWRRLEEDEAEALAAAAAGECFAELCVRLARRLGAERAPPRAAALLGRWLTDQWVSDVATD